MVCGYIDISLCVFINIVFCPCYLCLLLNVVLKCLVLCLITIIAACFPHLLICTCLISSPIACPPSSVLCWCLLCFFCIFAICNISLWLHFGLFVYIFSLSFLFLFTLHSRCWPPSTWLCIVVASYVDTALKYMVLSFVKILDKLRHIILRLWQKLLC